MLQLGTSTAHACHSSLHLTAFPRNSKSSSGREAFSYNRRRSQVTNKKKLFYITSSDQLSNTWPALLFWSCLIQINTIELISPYSGLKPSYVVVVSVNLYFDSKGLFTWREGALANQATWITAAHPLSWLSVLHVKVGYVSTLIQGLHWLLKVEQCDHMHPWWRFPKSFHTLDSSWPWFWAIRQPDQWQG